MYPQPRPSRLSRGYRAAISRTLLLSPSTTTTKPPATTAANWHRDRRCGAAANTQAHTSTDTQTRQMQISQHTNTDAQATQCNLRKEPPSWTPARTPTTERSALLSPLPLRVTSLRPSAVRPAVVVMEQDQTPTTHQPIHPSTHPRTHTHARARTHTHTHTHTVEK